MANDPPAQTPDPKDDQLDEARVDNRGSKLTTQQGLPIDHTDDSLKVGERGPTLMDDFHFREKITHFDHERIPERVVHARGAGAYGVFECTEPLTEFTRAAFLSEAGRRTPTFVRFSTVAGSRGSADTVRDVRGFATKFYTDEGNFDLVGNNMPVFFIQDAIKFPDFVHAVKPEPHNEIPQASSAHDTLWDFVSLTPETMHMIMWLMSDRALPRSYRTMQGFGVHTFRLVNAEGKSTFVKFHWRPMLGTHSMVWDETQKVAGNDPDFNRRDLWAAIESGTFPEYELGLQLVPEEREHDFDFDLLDPTKIIPEEEVPLRVVGRMTLNRNPDNFFAETEQVAFHLANVVPGIDFSNDPLLQGRLFSYLDTQLIRLGGPNFPQIPVNRPLADVHTNQRDGYHQERIDRGRTSYFPNSLSDGAPDVTPPEEGGYHHFEEMLEGPKIRNRSEKFRDFFSQATLFWNSMSSWERRHIVDAFQFELGKVSHQHVRERMVGLLNEVDHDLARLVAPGIGVEPPAGAVSQNHGRRSAALSQANQPTSLATRKVAILVGDGVQAEPIRSTLATLRSKGAICETLAPHAGHVDTADGGPLQVDRAITTMSSVLYDALIVADVPPDGDAPTSGDPVHWAAEAYKHGKAVGALGSGTELLRRAGLPGIQISSDGQGVVEELGVVTLASPDVSADGAGNVGEFAETFAQAAGGLRRFERSVDSVPA